MLEVIGPSERDNSLEGDCPLLFDCVVTEVAGEFVTLSAGTVLHPAMVGEDLGGIIREEVR